jgi:hypothetical protein
MTEPSDPVRIVASVPVELGEDTVVQAVGVDLDTSSAISGQITIATAGVAVQGPDATLTNGVYVRAMSTNTGLVYVGNDGANDVSSTNGYELASGQSILLQVDNISDIWFDASISGDKVCWLKA